VTTHQKSLPAERAHELLIRYGTLAERVIEDIIRFGDEPLTYTAGYSSGEVLSLASREKVVSLSDLTHRRTPLAFIGAISPQSLEELASVIGEFLGWSRAEQRRQVELVVSRQSALPRSSRAPREKTTAGRKTGIKH
jgi:glycerol-3-phosphate dehydrogenase